MKKLVLFIFGFLIFINLSSQELSKTDEIQYDSIDNGLTDSETKLIDSLLTALLSDSAFYRLKRMNSQVDGKMIMEIGNEHLALNHLLALT